QRYFTEYDRLLDENRKHEPFQQQRLAALVRRQLYQQQENYRLLAYSIMPNHVHIVLEASGSRDRAPLDQVRPTSGLSHAVPDRMDEQPDVRSPLVDYLRQLKTATEIAATQ